MLKLDEVRLRFFVEMSVHPTASPGGFVAGDGEPPTPLLVRSRFVPFWAATPTPCLR